MIGKTITVNDKDFVVSNFIGKGKSGYSYLIENAGVKYVLKMIHYEPCQYYDFAANKLEVELKAYEKLKNLITIPNLIEYNNEKQYLVKEYIDGLLAVEAIAQAHMQDRLFAQIFAISHRLAGEGINIDYFPTNFVIRDSSIVYVDYEFNQYDEKWNFNNWGIYYWVNREGMREFMKTNDYLQISIDAVSGIPIKEPFKIQVEDLIKKFEKVDNINRP